MYTCKLGGPIIYMYRIRPNYRTVRLDFPKLLNKLLAKYQRNKGTL